MAVLCRHKALDIKDMYLYLSTSDDKMRTEYNNHFDRVLKHMLVFACVRDQQCSRDSVVRRDIPRIYA